MSKYEIYITNSISIGDKFNRYTVISTHKISGTYKYYALCKCDCGNERYVRIDGLKSGKNKSCGCLHKESVTKHGKWDHPLYYCHQNMMRRCYEKTNKRYDRYGGRGITVCKRWHDINNFIHDMYPSYIEGLQIDRKDNDKNYSPDNCRWATLEQQARNKSNVKLYDFNGEKLCLAEISRLVNINRKTISDRIKKQGLSLHEAITRPVKS